jgi:hypothetical protein
MIKAYTGDGCLKHCLMSGMLETRLVHSSNNRCMAATLGGYCKPDDKR